MFRLRACACSVHTINLSGIAPQGVMDAGVQRKRRIGSSVDGQTEVSRAGRVSTATTTGSHAGGNRKHVGPPSANAVRALGRQRLAATDAAFRQAPRYCEGYRTEEGSGTRMDPSSDVPHCKHCTHFRVQCKRRRHTGSKSGSRRPATALEFCPFARNYDLNRR